MSEEWKGWIIEMSEKEERKQMVLERIEGLDVAFLLDMKEAGDLTPSEYAKAAFLVTRLVAIVKNC